MEKASTAEHKDLDRAAGLRAHLRFVWSEKTIRILMLVGVVFRLVLVFVPTVPHWAGDAPSYVEPARNMIQDARFALGTCPGPTCDTLLWRVPGYSLFIALFQVLPHLPLTALYLEQIVLDAFSMLLVAIIGWWVGGRRLGIAGAAFYALNPFIAVFAAVVMSDTLTFALVLLYTYASLRLADARLEWRPLGLIALGALIGAMTLTRQIYSLLPAFVLLCLLRRPFARWLRALAFVALGFWPMIVPWMLREYVAANEKGVTDPQMMMLAPPFDKLVRPGLAAWERSFEEPFVWENLHKPPVVARYLLPDEQARTAALIERLDANHLVNSPDIDAEFAAIARDRHEAHPFRTRVWAPFSRFLKTFAAPRLSSFGIVAGGLDGFRGKLLFLLAVAANAATSLPWFVYGLRRVRDARYRLLLVIPVLTVIAYLPITFGSQSRYVLPAVPHLAVLTGAWAFAVYDRLRARLAARASRAVDDTETDKTALASGG